MCVYSCYTYARINYVYSFQVFVYFSTFVSLLASFLIWSRFLAFPFVLGCLYGQKKRKKAVMVAGKRDMGVFVDSGKKKNLCIFAITLSQSIISNCDCFGSVWLWLWLSIFVLLCRYMESDVYS